MNDPRIPANAEHLIRSDFVTMGPREPSVFAPGAKCASLERFECPGCHDYARAEHGEPGRCSCGLSWISFGNSLYVWRR